MMVHNGRRPAHSPARVLAAGALLLASTACGDTPATSPADASGNVATTVTRVVVTPATASIPVGGSVTFKATGYTSTGAAVAVSCGWSVDNPAVATIDGGFAQGIAAGATPVKAGCGSIIAIAQLTVTAMEPPPPGPVAPIFAASVTVSPASASLQVGGTQQLTAVAKDSAGNVLNSTVIWSSSAPTVASVSATGLVTALAAGPAAVSATVDGKSAGSEITVTPGTVPPVLAASVTVSPASASLQVGGTQQLTAVATDAAGNVLNHTVTWSSSAPTIASVSATGLVTALAAGSATVTATVDGQSGGSAITVAASGEASALAASVSVSPASASLSVGGTQQLTAVAKDAAGNVLNHTVTWSSSAPGVASVSATGLVNALAAGSATVTATVDGKSAGAAITVAAATVTPPPTSPAPGLMFSDGFEPGYAASVNGAGWQTTLLPNVAVSTDVAHTGSHSLRFTYIGKADCLDATAELRFSFGRPMQEVWLEWYIYYPKGGEGGSAAYYHRWEYPVCPPQDQPDNNKFLALFGPTYPAEPTLLVQTWTTTLALSVPPSRPGDSRIQNAVTQAGTGTAFNQSNYMDFINGAADRGRWIQIRVHARIADFGVNDGVVQIWKDGVKILNDLNLPWYDSTNKANYLIQGYLLGWSNSGYTQTTNIYVDDFKIIGQNPGW